MTNGVSPSLYALPNPPVGAVRGHSESVDVPSGSVMLPRKRDKEG